MNLAAIAFIAIIMLTLTGCKDSLKTSIKKSTAEKMEKAIKYREMNARDGFRIEKEENGNVLVFSYDYYKYYSNLKKTETRASVDSNKNFQLELPEMGISISGKVSKDNSEYADVEISGVDAENFDAGKLDAAMEDLAGNIDATPTEMAKDAGNTALDIGKNVGKTIKDAASATYNFVKGLVSPAPDSTKEKK